MRQISGERVGRSPGHGEASGRSAWVVCHWVRVPKTRVSKAGQRRHWKTRQSWCRCLSAWGWSSRWEDHPCLASCSKTRRTLPAAGPPLAEHPAPGLASPMSHRRQPEAQSSSWKEWCRSATCDWLCAALPARSYTLCKCRQECPAS
jgi:hypothetical protein